MIARVAERDLIQLGALQEHVQVVLPREADPTVHLHPEAITRFDASEHQIFAVEAAIEASASSALTHQAAQYAVERIPSTSTSMSAQIVPDAKDLVHRIAEILVGLRRIVRLLDALSSP